MLRRRLVLALLVFGSALLSAAGAIAMVLSQLDNDERERVRALIAGRVASFDTADGIELPGVSLVASTS